MKKNNTNLLTTYLKNFDELLNKINDAYSDSDDEFENELYYSSLHKAREFSSNLKVIIKKRSENK